MKRAFSERVRRSRCLSSTNDEAKKTEIGDRDIILAARQSGGKGRHGRSFLSDEGGLYASFCYEVRFSPERLILVTGMCALAAKRATEKVCGISPEIKWTNDLIFRDKKICGVLCETVFDGEKPPKLIIGIGINANQEDFPAELSEIASSVYRLTGKRTDLDTLLRALAEETDAVIAALEAGDCSEYIEGYRESCSTLGKPVTVNPLDGSDPYEATATDIDEQFGLIIRTPSGERETLRGGEVSVRY